MFGSSDPAEIAGQMDAASVDALLLDSRDAGNAAAGGGSVLTHMQKDTLRQMRASFGGLIILGGGLNASNIREAVLTHRPDLADIMTGVEISPGKNPILSSPQLQMHYSNKIVPFFFIDAKIF